MKFINRIIRWVQSQIEGVAPIPVDSSATIRVRVNTAGVKIHGPNSPEVISGKFKEGHRENVIDGEKFRQMGYAEAVDKFGKDNADELFRGIEEEQYA